MKNNLRKLNLLFRFTKLKPEMFYSVSVYSDKIVLQGWYKPELSAIARNTFKESWFVSSNGYVEFRKYGIEVVLT